jgi:hypothetical protein
MAGLPQRRGGALSLFDARWLDDEVRLWANSEVRPALCERPPARLVVAEARCRLRC